MSQLIQLPHLLQSLDMSSLRDDAGDLVGMPCLDTSPLNLYIFELMP